MSPLIRHRFLAFGGAACEVLVGDGTEADVSAVVSEVYAFEAQLTRFAPGSELSRFNARAGSRVEVSPLLGALLRACLDAHARSDGLVNAVVGRALVAAGYDRTIEAIRSQPPGAGRRGGEGPGGGLRSEPGSGPEPADGATRGVPPLPEVLEVGDGWARLAPGCLLDLGGIGKGWLADSLCERFDDACVNLGGDLRALGPGPGGRGWAVGLCDGRTLLIADGGAATSGTMSRRWPGGHHLIDPRTGRPSRSEAVAVSVVAAGAAAAEVLAKAAILVGPAAAGEWLPAHGARDWAAIWAGP